MQSRTADDAGQLLPRLVKCGRGCRQLTLMLFRDATPPRMLEAAGCRKVSSRRLCNLTRSKFLIRQRGVALILQHTFRIGVLANYTFLTQGIGEKTTNVYAGPEG